MLETAKFTACARRLARRVSPVRIAGSHASASQTKTLGVPAGRERAIRQYSFRFGKEPSRGLSAHHTMLRTYRVFGPGPPAFVFLIS